MRGLNLHTSDGVISAAPGLGVLDAYGKDVPEAGTCGYAKGCTFRHTASVTDAVLYVNTGTYDSCDFKTVTVGA